jgi:hypothetical protein
MCLTEGGEICGNYEDDDGDGRADCADTDCLGHPICDEQPPLENCHNSFDDDGDGDADCQDSDCTDTSFCIPDEDCQNGVDDDRDGLTDCDDPACVALPLCGACDPNEDLGDVSPGESLVRELSAQPVTGSSMLTCPEASGSGWQVRATFAAPVHLRLELDVSAGDLAAVGLIREQAPSETCEMDEMACSPVGEQGNATVLENGLFPGTYRFAVKGVGNLTQPPVLRMEVTDGTVEQDCQDSVDEDSDGLTDCDDPDCQEVVACLPEDCENGVDDNEDGLTDCDDPGCVQHPACLPPEECQNSLDDDGDSKTDCADPDCIGGASCVGSDCVVNHELGDLGRGDMVSWSFDTSLASDDNQTSCGGGMGGPDVVASFTLTHSATVEIGLTQQGYHVFGLAAEAGPGSWCDAAEMGCIDPGGVGLPVEAAYMLPAARYFVLVDAVSEAATGLGEIDLVVWDPSVELCHDGLDNDGDGLADCDDPECGSSASCVPEASCHDDVDDDGDGLTDCEDLDCVGSLACVPSACAPDRDMGSVGPLSPGYAVSTTLGWQDRYSAPCAAGGGGPDRVFRFTLEQGSGVVLRLNQESSSDHVLALALPGGPAGSCDEAIHLCEEAGGAGLPIVVEKEWLPAGDYFVLVDSYGPWGEGGFALQVSLW